MSEPIRILLVCIFGPVVALLLLATGIGILDWIADKIDGWKYSSGVGASGARFKPSTSNRER